MACILMTACSEESACQVWFGVHPTLQSRTSCTIKVDYHASHSNFLLHSIKIEKIDAPHCIQVTHLLYFIRVMIVFLDNAAAHSDTESRVLNHTQSFMSKLLTLPRNPNKDENKVKSLDEYGRERRA